MGGIGMERKGNILTALIWGTLIGILLWMSFLGWLDIIFGK
jgi:hypothetical protein